MTCQLCTDLMHYCIFVRRIFFQRHIVFCSGYSKVPFIFYKEWTIPKSYPFLEWNPRNCIRNIGVHLIVNYFTIKRLIRSQYIISELILKKTSYWIVSNLTVLWDHLENMLTTMIVNCILNGPIRNYFDCFELSKHGFIFFFKWNFFSSSNRPLHKIQKEKISDYTLITCIVIFTWC